MVKSLRASIITVLGALAMLLLVSGCTGSGASSSGFGPSSKGGTVLSQDGNASLTLPDNSGILLKSVQITSDNTPLPDAGLVTGTAYTFSPDDAIEGLGTITIKYNVANIPAGHSQNNLALFRLTGVGWAEVDGSLVDVANSTVTAQVTTMGVYALIATS